MISSLHFQGSAGEKKVPVAEPSRVRYAMPSLYDHGHTHAPLLYPTITHLSIGRELSQISATLHVSFQQTLSRRTPNTSEARDSERESVVGKLDSEVKLNKSAQAPLTAQPSADPTNVVDKPGERWYRNSNGQHCCLITQAPANCLGED